MASNRSAEPIRPEPMPSVSSPASFGARWVTKPSVRLVRGAILRGGFGPLVRYYGRPQVSGLEHLAEVAPPVIFAANHLSHMDTPTLLLALPRPLRRRTLVLAAADYFYRTRRKAAFVTLAIGTIPVERDRPGSASLRALEALMEEGWNVLAYPEGSRSRDGRLYKGKTGLARVALDTRAPVVPIGVRGTHEAMPSSARWPKRGHVEVHFGCPLRFDRHFDRPVDRFVLRSVTDEIMYEIMLLSGQEYVDEYAYKPGRGQTSGVPAEGSRAEAATDAVRDGGG